MSYPEHTKKGDREPAGEFGKGLRKITFLHEEEVASPPSRLPAQPHISPQNPYLGKWTALEVLRITPPGAYLAVDTEEVLLPRRYFPEEGLQEGDLIEAFIYHDNEGRLIATTLHPYVLLGEVAFLEVKAVTQEGAFMGWGIHRDLFVPFAEQPSRFVPEASYPIVVYIDHISGRLTGSGELRKHIGNELPDYSPGEAVEALIVEHHERGYRAVVDHRYWGMLYHSDLAEELSVGSRTTAYIVRTREDGKLDLAPNPIGVARLKTNSDYILQLLTERGGSLPLGDKSSAEDIAALTKLSKKAFKMAIGVLYKQRLIELTPQSIHLTKGKPTPSDTK